MHTSWKRRNNDEDGPLNSIQEISPMLGQLFYSLMTGKNVVIIIMSLINWPELICGMTKKVIKGECWKCLTGRCHYFWCHDSTITLIEPGMDNLLSNATRWKWLKVYSFIINFDKIICVLIFQSILKLNLKLISRTYSFFHPRHLLNYFFL